MEIAAMVASESFGQHHGRNLRRPKVPPPQLGQTSSLTRKRAETAGVQDEGHAAPVWLPVPVREVS